MITDYLIECNYNLTNLCNHLYFIKNMDYKLELDTDNNYQVSQINGTIKKVKVDSIEFKEDESYDKRFAFQTDLTIKIGEDGRYLISSDGIAFTYQYLIIEQIDGSKYLLCPQHPYELKYKLTKTDKECEIEITFTSLGDIPTIRLADSCVLNYTNYSIDFCKYRNHKAINLQLIEFENLLDDGDKTIKIINNSRFKNVQYLDGTFKWEESYEDGVVKDSIEFKIPMSEYKSTWHYNILEFAQNRFIALIGGDYSSNLIKGVRGMFPSFVTNSSVDKKDSDIITITLSSDSNNFGLSNYDYDITGGTETKYYVPDENEIKRKFNYDVNVCVGVGYAIHTLLEERNNTGTLIGYWVMEGYDYPLCTPKLGTYNENSEMGVPIKYQSNKCVNNCTISKGFPYQINISNSATYVINTSCDWTITNNSSNFSVSPISGSANENTSVTVTRIGENSFNNSFVFGCCDYSTNINVKYSKPSPVQGCLSPTEFTVLASGGTVTTYAEDGVDISSLTLSIPQELTMTKGSNFIRFTVPQNASENTKEYTISASCGTNITIHQNASGGSQTYERWTEYSTECVEPGAPFVPPTPTSRIYRWTLDDTKTECVEPDAPIPPSPIS